MAENKPATPEQQLLKLIEGQGKPGAAGASGAGSVAKKPRGRGFSPAAILGALSFWKRRSKKKSFARRSPFSIGEMNKALVAVSLVLFVYVTFDAVASARNLQRPPNFAPMKERVAKSVKGTAEPLAEASYFLQKISSRDIFREGKTSAPVQAAPVVATPAETAEVVQGLALVGISWSSNPDAIIEDKARQRTYFVKRGQDVGDGIKVEAIFKDHVVVTYEDREYELR